VAIFVDLDAVFVDLENWDAVFLDLDTVSGVCQVPDLFLRVVAGHFAVRLRTQPLQLYQDLKLQRGF